ncbi:MAG: hypothetical protein IJO33_03510 [Bacilli bacterium]|nr:hypothetical protein [Bacilli bacterium]
MRQDILDFYKKTSMYTNYEGFYEYFKSLPDDLEELRKIIRNNIIHRVCLLRAFKENNEAITKHYPWYKNRCDDDILLTAPAMMAELFRQDERGLTNSRKVEDMIIVTCRYVSVLTASILKAKGYSVRVRSGFAPWIRDNEACDHWICQYYNEEEARWVDYDVDEEIHDDPTKKLIMAAESWLDVRSGKKDCSYFVHGSRLRGLPMLARSLFFDFHALMNDEISYLFFPTYIDTDEEFFKLSPDDLKELDDLATLLLDPDKNFDELKYLFRNDKKLRALNFPLINDSDHLE